MRIFEPRYVDMVKKCMRTNQGFGILLIQEGKEVRKESTDAPVRFASLGTKTSKSNRGIGRFLPHFLSFLNQQNAEPLVRAHTLFNHVHVSRFKDPQWQLSSGKQNSVQRKQAQCLSISQAESSIENRGC